MKKVYLFLIAFIGLSLASAAQESSVAEVKIGPDEVYTTVNDALANTTGDVVLVLTGDAYTGANINTITNRSVTIKSEEGQKHSLKRNRALYTFEVQAAGTLVLENIVIANGLSQSATAAAIVCSNKSGASLTMKNVEVDGLNNDGTKGSSGSIIAVMGDGTARIENLVAKNCTVTPGNAFLEVSGNNVTVSGDNEFSVILNGAYVLNADAGLNNSLPQKLYIANFDLLKDKTVVRGTSEVDNFTLCESGATVTAYMLMPDKSGNSISLIPIPTVYNQTKSQRYETLEAAVNAADTDDEIIIFKNVTLGSRLNIGSRTLSIYGNDKSVELNPNNVSASIVSFTEGGSLTISNLTISAGNDAWERNSELFQPSNGSLRLEDVLIKNFTATNSYGLIRQPSTGKSLDLYNVSFDNCNLGDKILAFVTIIGSGCEINGVNENMTVFVNKNYSISAPNLLIPITVLPAGGIEAGVPFVTECYDLSMILDANGKASYAVYEGGIGKPLTEGIQLPYAVQYYRYGSGESVGAMEINLPWENGYPTVKIPEEIYRDNKFNSIWSVSLKLKCGTDGVEIYWRTVPEEESGLDAQTAYATDPASEDGQAEGWIKYDDDIDIMIWQLGYFQMVARKEVSAADNSTEPQVLLSPMAQVHVVDGKMQSIITGVEEIENDNNTIESETEYFNLQGMKVDSDSLVPGIYVRRQGAKVSKIVVR